MRSGVAEWRSKHSGRAPLAADSSAASGSGLKLVLATLPAVPSLPPGGFKRGSANGPSWDLCRNLGVSMFRRSSLVWIAGSTDSVRCRMAWKTRSLAAAMIGVISTET